MEMSHSSYDLYIFATLRYDFIFDSTCYCSRTVYLACFILIG